MSSANVQLCPPRTLPVRDRANGSRGHRPSEVPHYVWFWRWVDQSGGPETCWPWTRGRDTAGYGQYGFQKAHRVAYRLAKGPIQAGLDICHTCDSPPCCNPAHLWAGTPRENLQDAARKGRLGARPLDWPQVRAIRAAAANGARQGNLARRYAVSQALISYIVNNRRWIEPADEATA